MFNSSPDLCIRGVCKRLFVTLDLWKGEVRLRFVFLNFCATFLDAPESPMFLTLGLLHLIFWMGGIDEEVSSFYARTTY
jgi:hypothetical protein